MQIREEKFNSFSKPKSTESYKKQALKSPNHWLFKKVKDKDTQFSSRIVLSVSLFFLDCFVFHDFDWYLFFLFWIFPHFWSTETLSSHSNFATKKNNSRFFPVFFLLQYHGLSNIFIFFFYRANITLRFTTDRQLYFHEFDAQLAVFNLLNPDMQKSSLSKNWKCISIAESSHKQRTSESKDS